MAQEPESGLPPLPRVRYIQSGSPLTQPMAPFVGRVHEIDAIRGMMADPQVRLVTLIGPGGVGKTRLALQAATGMTDILHRAIHFVPLAAINSPAGVPLAIANALDASDGAARPLIVGIQASLRDRPALIVLDNLEHVLPDAAGLVSEILTACPSLNILATSRSPLRLYGERRFPVRPLAITWPMSPVDSSSHLEEPDAVRLFILRAQAVDPDLLLTDSNRGDIAEICRRLDGLPLAIELAAARAAELPPRAYLQRLVQSLPLPSGGSRDMPQRQQTMTAAVGWSYQLLSPDQQTMFRRLAVFAGEFDLDAAEAMAVGIAPDPSPPDELARSAVHLLVELAEASLVQRRTDAAGEPRYHMLDTIRTYGLDRGKASGEAEALHERHAMYYLQLVAEANRELLTGRELVLWLGYLDDRLSNIRSAMAWCERADPHLLVQFTRQLMQYWLRRSRIQEGTGWLSRARLAESRLSEIDRGWVLTNFGRLHQYTAADGVAACYQGALDIARRHDNRELLLAVHIGQALFAILNNQPEDARIAHGDAANIPDVEHVALQVTQPTFLSVIEAMVAGMSGELDRARDLAAQALARATSEGDDIAPALLHRILGMVERAHGNLEGTRAHTLTALEAYDAVHEGWNIGTCLMDLAGLFQQDHPELALRLAGAADRLLTIHGARRINPDREPFRSLASELRQRLGAEVVSMAWHEGAAQSWRSILNDAHVTPVDQQPAESVVAAPTGIGGTLSLREHQVLRLIAEGQSDREIALTLGLSYRTITSYVTNILTKLDVPSRTAAAIRATRDGFLDS